MTMADRRIQRWRDRLGTRLAAAFMATTLATVAVVTAIAWTASGMGAETLLAERREQVGDDVVVALESAYLMAGGWEQADLLPAHTLAATAGAVLVVTTPELGELPTPSGLDLTRRRLHGEDDPGTTSQPGDDGVGEMPQKDVPEDDVGTGDGPDSEGPVRQGRTDGEGAPPTGAGPRDPAPDAGTSEHRQQRSDLGEPRAAPAVVSFATIGTNGSDVRAVDEPATLLAGEPVDERRELPIVVDGVEIGTATLVFVDLDLADADDGFREAVARRLILGAGVALVLAVLVTAFVTSRLTRPLRTLTAEVNRLRGAGTTSMRPPVTNAPGEIAVLSDALIEDDRRPAPSGAAPAGVGRGRGA